MMIRVARLEDRRERNRKTNEKNVDDAYKSSKRLYSSTKQEEEEEDEVTSRRSMTMKMREGTDETERH